MNEKLKRCPFCGGRAEKFRSFEGITAIVCKNKKDCGAIVSFKGNESTPQAINAWNRRVEDSMKTYKYSHCATCSYSQFDIPCPINCTGNYYSDYREISGTGTNFSPSTKEIDWTPPQTTTLPYRITPQLDTAPSEATITPVVFGWICPKCGAVMSPTQVCCVNCSGAVSVPTTGE